jgi:hypothetical protein
MSNKKTRDVEVWEPPLGETQRKLFWDTAPYILAHGERGSGKTRGLLNKGVKHAHLYDDALVMITTLTRTGATAGGAWEELLNEGVNHKGDPHGVLKLWEQELGLVCSGEYGDDAKNKFIDIRTVNGKKSRMMLRSMPVAQHIKARVKGTAPSFFLYEELTDTDVDDNSYFYDVIQQLGRRGTVPAHAQQWCASCNPADEGDQHWVHKTFFQMPWSTDDKTGEKVWDKDYAVYHVPMTENVWMEDKAGYLKKVEQACRNDPTAYDRLILGKWVPKVTGSGIFQNYFIPEIHVKGEPRKSGLVPKLGEPIIIGYDTGDVNNSRTFLQRNQSGKKIINRVIDESIFVQKKKSFRSLVLELYDRMAWWCERFDHLFTFYHIGDRAAKTHFNPMGSFESLQLEKESKEIIEEFERFKDLAPIRMLCPPKGAGSVEDRVRIIQDKLASEQLMVSATCPMHVEMFRMLRKSKVRGAELDYKPLKTIKGEIHTFDSLSYPIYYYELRARPPSFGDGSEKNLEVVSFNV